MWGPNVHIQGTGGVFPLFYIALVGLVIHFGVPNLLTKYHQQVLEIDQKGQ